MSRFVSYTLVFSIWASIAIAHGLIWPEHAELLRNLGFVGLGMLIFYGLTILLNWVVRRVL